MEYAIKMGVGQISLCFQPVKYIFKILGLKGAPQCFQIYQSTSVIYEVYANSEIIYL